MKLYIESTDAAWLAAGDAAWLAAGDAARHAPGETAGDPVIVDVEFFFTVDGEALRIIDEKDETR